MTRSRPFGDQQSTSAATFKRFAHSNIVNMQTICWILGLLIGFGLGLSPLAGQERAPPSSSQAQDPLPENRSSAHLRTNPKQKPGSTTGLKSASPAGVTGTTASKVVGSPSQSRQEQLTSTPGYLGVLLRMVFGLGAVCLLAYFALRFGLRRFLPGPSPWLAENFEVIARLPLEPKRSILLVRVGSRYLLVGSSEQGLSALGNLTPEEVEAFSAGDSAPQIGTSPAPESTPGSGTISSRRTFHELLFPGSPRKEKKNRKSTQQSEQSAENN